MQSALPAVSEPLIAGAEMLDTSAIDIPEVEADVPDNISVDPDTGIMTVDNDDGSITIDLSGNGMATMEVSEEAEEHDANLADHLSAFDLGRIANDLLEAIEADKRDRSEWERMRAKSVDQLGLKLEDPKGDVSQSATGMATSSVKDPILLEAVERFRANAYGELCPASGPVKVVSWSTKKDQTGQQSSLADDLQDDLNYYLTTTASEYYPDTRFMLWWTGLASGTFKKVYRCPLRQRPVSEYVDGTDLIVPSTATDLKNAPRVTHESKMQRDTMRAMQLAGVYRNISLGDPMPGSPNVVDAKVASVEGKAAQPQRIEDQEYTVYECYCKIDLPGFEHVDEDGNPTGLPLPYRVSIEEGSREVLEVRRNWDPEDDEEIFRQPQIPFVLFPYSTGVSRIYGAGLGQMLGNMASALTALLRISIDNGMMSNYPGLLKAKSDGRQIQNQIVVPPGGVAEIDTGGLPIQQAVMGMPFKDVSSAVIQLIEQTRGVAQRLGGTADMPVGEGRQDAPVGTTLALIEQATKVEGSVHKALHAAQAEEFRLLMRLFKDDPEALWRGNRRPKLGSASDEAAKQQRIARFLQALDDCDIQPMADPNVPSDMHRNLMAMGFKQFTVGNPMYNPLEVDKYVCRQVFKMSDREFAAMLAPPAPAPQLDPVMAKQLELAERKVVVDENRLGLEAQKNQLQAQDKQADRDQKANIEALKLATQHERDMQPDAPEGIDQLKIAEIALKRDQNKLKAADISYRAANAQADRESKETIEAIKLANSLAVHPGSDPVVDEQLQQMGSFLSPATQNGMGSGGRVQGRRGFATGGSPRDGAWNAAPVSLGLGGMPVSQPAGNGMTVPPPVADVPGNPGAPQVQIAPPMPVQIAAPQPTPVPVPMTTQPVSQPQVNTPSVMTGGGLQPVARMPMEGMWAGTKPAGESAIGLNSSRPRWLASGGRVGLEDIDALSRALALAEEIQTTGYGHMAR